MALYLIEAHAIAQLFHRQSLMQSDRQQHPSLYPTVSVVVPVLNERASLDALYSRLNSVLGEISSSFEIIFVDDGSTDRSIEKLREISAIDRSVRYIRFRRNFGKSAALA